MVSALKSFLERLHDPVKALEALQTHMPSSKLRNVADTFNILDQSWWLKLVMMTYLLDVQHMKSKANIPVEQGARVFGAPDPKGVLREGQVYCAIMV